MKIYLSYFYVGNELSNVFIILLPVTLLYLIDSNSYLLKAIFLILLLVTTFLMSTKTFYASIFIILLYFIFIKRRQLMRFVKNNILKTTLTIAVILAFCIVYIPKMDLVNNIEASLEHYEVNKVQELLTYKNIDNVIFSSRLSFLENVNKNFYESSSVEKLLGLGRQRLDNIKNVEIDIFDIFYSIGILGTAFYLFFFGYILDYTKVKGVYKFTFVLLLIISCFTGHVLISPFTSTYLALLFIVSKNDLGKMKKNVLMVSNMYPSQEYPHYGIFVKNTYDLLSSNGVSIDSVVMLKTNGKWNKLIAYFKLFSVSFFKAIFNNYDYIYVHFVSHTTIGVFIPSLLSKSKLVLNVHGNDIIPDTHIDEKYMWLSKLFLKKADVVISPSKYFEQILVKKYNISKNKIVVYPSGGVDIEKFKKINKRTAIKNAGLDHNYKYFGYVSRIEKNKGYDIFIKAINEFKKNKKYKDIRFILVGSGSEENKLDDLIKKYKLQKLIIRHPLVSQDELVYIYNSLEAFIYPTRMQSESLGLTGLEAMACETLVIGSNKYGPSDYLIYNENSFTFNPTDYKRLAEKMIDVLELNSNTKNKLVKNGRKKSEEYSFSNTKDIILNVFKNK